MSKNGDCCAGKVRHHSKHGACIAVRKMNHCAMNVYKCPKCGFWHLGNSRDPWRQQQRIDQILSRYPQPEKSR